MKILAVSGGIDSMVLMESFRGNSEVVVAHFNHGTRPSANEDEEFVRKWAGIYGFKFISKKGRLGERVSEERARAERYRFLKQVADEEGGTIVTAHHREDVIESIAINLLRGTGWRGVAVMGREEIERPMIKMSRAEIYRRAAEKGIHFRQDPTNVEDRYLRNRVREKLAEQEGSPTEHSKETSRQDGRPKEVAGWRERISELRERQLALEREVDETIKELLPEDGRYQRAWFSNLEDEVAMEILRAGLLRAGASATRLQIREFLEAIRTYAPEKKFNLPGDRLVTLHKTYFVL